MKKSDREYLGRMSIWVVESAEILDMVRVLPKFIICEVESARGNVLITAAHCLYAPCIIVMEGMGLLFMQGKRNGKSDMEPKKNY